MMGLGPRKGNLRLVLNPITDSISLDSKKLIKQVSVAFTTNVIRNASIAQVFRVNTWHIPVMFSSISKPWVAYLSQKNIHNFIS